MYVKFFSLRKEVSSEPKYVPLKENPEISTRL
jgi:hypothetical protein